MAWVLSTVSGLLPGLRCCLPETGRVLAASCCPPNTHICTDPQGLRRQLAPEKGGERRDMCSVPLPLPEAVFILAAPRAGSLCRWP